MRVAGRDFVGATHASPVNRVNGTGASPPLQNTAARVRQRDEVTDAAGAPYRWYVPLIGVWLTQGLLKSQTPPGKTAFIFACCASVKLTLYSLKFTGFI